MREYELVIDEATKNGLGTETVIHFNDQVLHECLGFRCGKKGLEAYTELDNPIDSIDIDYNWPFPQFISGEGYGILVVRDSDNSRDLVYTVSLDHSVVTLISTLSWAAYGQGGLMKVADFGEYLFMTNGVAMIYWDPTLASWQTTAAIATIPLMSTVCNFKGQAVGGGVSSAWHDCDTTFYCWSNIGSIDFTLSDRNEAGYRRCPYGGDIYDTLRLKDAVIGYSSKGITAIGPVSSPAATFGFMELGDIGLINKGAVSGNLGRHIYLGEDYILREVTREGIKEIGYQYYMEELAGSEDIIINYDPSKRDFYIGNSTKTYLLSPYGLTEVPQHPSTIWRRDKESYMLPGSVDTYEPLIVTGIFDMGYKGQKTVTVVETDAFLGITPQAAIDWANDLTTWGYGSFVPINNQGIASAMTSGNFFRFRLKFGSTYQPFTVSYIKARYKMTDLRGIRGVYAPPLRGQ